MKMAGIFVLTMLCIFILDMLWLGYIAKSIYADSIGGLMRRSSDGMQPIIWSAGVVYVCIALGITYFVLPAAGSDLFTALLGGAVLGIVTYGIYDFTNYSILDNWPLKITIIDFLWGTLLCGLSSLFALYVKLKIS